MLKKPIIEYEYIEGWKCNYLLVFENGAIQSYNKQIKIDKKKVKDLVESLINNGFFELKDEVMVVVMN